MSAKEFAFIAIATAVAVIVVEPLFESVLKKVSPAIAAKIGVV